MQKLFEYFVSFVCSRANRANVFGNITVHSACPITFEQIREIENGIAKAYVTQRVNVLNSQLLREEEVEESEVDRRD